MNVILLFIKYLWNMWLNYLTAFAYFFLILNLTFSFLIFPVRLEAALVNRNNDDEVNSFFLKSNLNSYFFDKNLIQANSDSEHCLTQGKSNNDNENNNNKDNNNEGNAITSKNLDIPLLAFENDNKAKNQLPKQEKIVGRTFYYEDSMETKNNGVHGLSLLNEGIVNANLIIKKSHIRTTGNNANGVLIDTTFSGGISDKSKIMTKVTLRDSVKIETYGDKSNGLFNLNQGGGSAITIIEDGSIKTIGNESPGVHSWIKNNDSKEPTSVVMNRSHIETHGHKGSHGLLNRNNGFGETYTTMFGGRIYTYSSESYGIFTRIENPNSVAHAKAIMKEGTLKTYGKESHGLVVIHDGIGGDVHVCLEDGATIQTVGAYAHGISAYVMNEISTANVIATLKDGTIMALGEGADGLNLNNQGTGMVNLELINSRVKGGLGNAAAIGIKTKSGQGSSINIKESSVVDGSPSGIAIRSEQNCLALDGEKTCLTVHSSGTVIGDVVFGSGNDIFNLIDGSLTGHIIGDNGKTFDQNNLNTDKSRKNNQFGIDHFNWQGGILQNGGFVGNGGQDEAVIAAHEYDGTQLLDGGGSFNDKKVMEVDVLTLNLKKNSSSLSVSKNKICNWERINLSGGRITFQGKTLKTGTGLGQQFVDGNIIDVALGVHIFKDGVLDGLDGSFVLNGDLVLSDNTAIFDGTGGGNGKYQITGNVKNDGHITTRDGKVGDRVNINGDYTGKGIFEMDVETKTGMSDEISVDGNVSGETKIKINNISSNRGIDKRILLVKVKGFSAPGRYVLHDDTMTVGAFNYDITYEPGQHFLSTSLNSTGATYSSMPIILAHFNRFPSFHQRVGLTRKIKKREDDNSYQSWVRLQKDRSRFNHKNKVEIRRTSDAILSGIDRKIMENQWGKLVFGVTGHFDKIHGNIENLNQNGGKGHIITSGYGIGVTATFKSNLGSYIDIQGKRNWIHSDFSSSNSGKLISDYPNIATAISLESGNRIMLKKGKHFLIPQAQLIWGYVNSVSFVDKQKNPVDFSSSSNLVGRLGILLEHNRSNKSYYVEGNVLRYFSENSDVGVTVAGSDLDAVRGDTGTWADISFGGEKYIGGRKLAGLFWNVSYRTEIDGSLWKKPAYGASVGILLNW